MKETIHSIFPTPIYISKLNRDFTPLELKFIDKHKKDYFQNVGNISSNNNYILNEKPFANIKKEIDKRIQDYFQKVISNTNKITPYITQSWLNKVQPGGYHTLHNHRNSYLSGVFYIKCVPDDNIMFNNKYRKINPSFEFPKKVTTPTNNDVIQVKVEEGDLILFNSLLPHAVMPNETEDIDRISLSFDTFPTYLPSLYPPFK